MESRSDNPAEENHASLAQPHFDQAELIDCVGGDESLAHNIVEIFLENSKTILEEISSRNELENRLELISFFHRLNGSAASIGAHRFSAVCRQWEQTLARREDAESREPLLDETSTEEVRKAYLALAQELNRFLK